MKTNKLTVLIFTFLHFLSYSQISKGHWLIGGQGDFSYYNSKRNQDQTGNLIITGGDFNLYEINLEPNIGYFISDKLAIGIKSGFQSWFDENNPMSIKNTQFSIIPFVRYYLLEIDKNFNFFVEPSYYYYTYNPLGKSIGYGAKFGYVYFLNNSVGIEPSLNYHFRKSEQISSNRFFFGLGLQLYLEKE